MRKVFIVRRGQFSRRLSESREGTMPNCDKCNDHGIIRVTHGEHMAQLFCTCPAGMKEKNRAMDMQDAKEVSTKDGIDSFFDRAEGILDWLGVSREDEEE